MTLTKKVFYLLLSMAGIIFLPYLGAWIHFEGQFPEKYFNYPPLESQSKDGFNLVIFIAISVIFIATAILYLFPSIFGFRKTTIPSQLKFNKVTFPLWFWVGLLLWGGTLFVLWGKFNEPKWLLNWAFLPLFWGFTLVLDGWVYKRTGGNSLISKSPREIIGIGVAAMSGWMLFEYLNFFVDENWYYPHGDSIPDDEFTVYAILGSSGLMPAVFELYTLMNTFPGFNNKYTLGPRIILPDSLKTIALFLALAAMFAIGFFPDTLFGVLWVSPLIIISVVLEKLGIWTPFTPIKEGNWSPVLKYALTYLIYGLLLECWNYLSGIHDNHRLIETHTPAYWVYSLPYVDTLHVFEMPLLGFLGYLPFGIYCAVWWISFAYLLGIPTQFSNDKLSNDELAEVQLLNS